MSLSVTRSVGIVAVALLAGGISSGGSPVFAQDYSQEPLYGALTLDAGFPNDPRTIDLTAGGSIDAWQSLGGDCAGHIANAPDYRLHYTAGSFDLSIFAESSADLTLVINGPDGRWHCNDDYRGLDPAVQFTNPMSGQYDIWVGTFGESTASATLYISEFAPFSGMGGGSSGGGSMGSGGAAGGPGPDWSLQPAFGSLSLEAGFPNDPRSIDLVAGGSIPAWEHNLGPDCGGYIAEAPDYRLHYTAGSFDLSIFAESSADLTLVINGPDGRWHCNDDYRDLDPAVQFTNPVSGQYDIWVGTFGESTANATLYISEFAPFSGMGGGSMGGAGGPGPDWSLQPAFGSLTLEAGFPNDPRSIDLVAGGSIPAWEHNLGPDCGGYIAEAPDYRLHYTAGSFDLSIFAESSADLTLVINGPDGRWHCNDDYRGLDPAVQFTNPVSGQYDIWVGTFGESTANATLSISEFAPFSQN